MKGILFLSFLFLISCGKPEKVGYDPGYYQNYLTLEDLGGRTLGIKTTCEVPYHLMVYTTQLNTLEAEYWHDHPCMSSINTMQKSYKVITMACPG